MGCGFRCMGIHYGNLEEKRKEKKKRRREPGRSRHGGGVRWWTGAVRQRRGGRRQGRWSWQWQQHYRRWRGERETRGCESERERERDSDREKKMRARAAARHGRGGGQRAWVSISLHRETEKGTYWASQAFHVPFWGQKGDENVVKGLLARCGRGGRRRASCRGLARRWTGTSTRRGGCDRCRSAWRKRPAALAKKGMPMEARAEGRS